MNAHTFTKQVKKFKQTSFAAETVLWERKGVVVMQQGTTIMSEVYSETLKENKWSLRAKGVEC
jgi:hypothetical protein